MNEPCFFSRKTLKRRRCARSLGGPKFGYLIITRPPNRSLIWDRFSQRWHELTTVESRGLFLPVPGGRDGQHRSPHPSPGLSDSAGQASEEAEPSQLRLGELRAAASCPPRGLGWAEGATTCAEVPVPEPGTHRVHLPYCHHTLFPSALKTLRMTSSQAKS